VGASKASLSCLVLFLKSAPSGRAFSGACRSRPTLYRAEYHTPVGRVLRSYALEPISGRCAALTHVLPVLDHEIVENTIRSDLSHQSHLSKKCPDPNHTTPNYTLKLSI